MIEATTKNILRNYAIQWESHSLTEEEFVYDSLNNAAFFAMIQDTQIHLLHLSDEAKLFWDDMEGIGSPNEDELHSISIEDNIESFSATSK